jgi:basic membrane lipoprotein Med (substrate-binding protein (PBP1-ABC) superfamily)/DNA-binding SARP family transcriptional activator
MALAARAAPSHYWSSAQGETWVEYWVLGSLEVRSGGERVALGSHKQQAVLAILLLHAGDIVPADRLIEFVWGEHPPRTATHSIQIYVSELRKVLERDDGRPVIATRPPGYVLAADPASIDARQFELLLAEGARELEAGNASAAADLTREGLRRWRGSPLSDFAYEEFAQDEIRRLEALHVDALEQLAAAELDRDAEHAALVSIEAAIAEDPLRERSRELQMLALYRSGRHPEALRAYELFRGLLTEELGLDPSPSLQQLYERVLLHDPSLGRRALRRPAPAAMPERNPYKGLRPFGEEDADDFFGREALVEELVGAVARGTRLLTLVGPSGSGKSSVIHAGLLPALRAAEAPGADAWVIAEMTPGQPPFEELEAALMRAVPEAPLAAAQVDDGDRGMLAPSQRILGDGRRLLLVIDQFEELFSFGDEPVRRRFLRNLAAAGSDPTGLVTVALALRADFYDRPLRYPDFASAFTPGVVNVVPMAADDLEAAMVRPARRVGVEVEPALMAQLMADTADQPGALPLLEYTLTELFENMASPVLTLDGYRALGGLHGVLSRRAEDAYGQLDEDAQLAALQVFLRLVRLGEGSTHVRRRVPLHELTSLDLDPVGLSEVLHEFGRYRLLAFDRDPASGGASVEVAHEALLWEWERLAWWIDQHCMDLRQHDSFARAASEWEVSGRDRDYLPIGSRLGEFEAWSHETMLQLTPRERAFLDAAITRRRADQAEEAARRDLQHQLEGRARARLWALLAVIAVLAAGAAFGLLSMLGDHPPDVALLVEGTGDAGFGDMAVAGLRTAANDLALTTEVTSAKAFSREVESELRRLSGEGVPVVMVGIGPAAEAATATVAADYPGTRYVVYEYLETLPNEANLTFRSEEAAYLAGAAAALKSRTGIIGFLGALRHPVIDGYLAGYEAGARSVDKAVDVRVAYLADLWDAAAFNSETLGAEKASQLYSEGADVILAVAGKSSLGVFKVAASASTRGARQLWAIGVDTDEYLSLPDTPPDALAGVDPASLQQHVLTSVMKRLDIAFAAVLADLGRGRIAPGVRSFGLTEGGVDISYSGGFIDDIRPRLEALKRQIIKGVIAVPFAPADAVQTPGP